jgi:uncharacterized membrane protein YqjE
MEAETPTDDNLHLAGASKQVAQRLLVICENRLELLLVELHEERDRILLAIWLTISAAAVGLLAGITLTALIVVALWKVSPVLTLLILTVLYAAAAVFLYARLSKLQREWETLPATIEQLKKDRECLEKKLA